MTTPQSIIQARADYDLQEYDTFLPIVSVYNFEDCGQIVIREGLPDLFGFVDQTGRTVLPIAFDAIDLCLDGMALSLMVKSNEHCYYGLWSIPCQRMIAKVQYDEVQTSCLSDYLWCRLNGQWSFCNSKNGTITHVSKAMALLESSHYRCVLCTDDYSDNLRLMCVNDDGLEQKNDLRHLTLEQMAIGGNTGRIHLFNNKLNIEVIANVYGEVLFTNYKIDSI